MSLPADKDFPHRPTHDDFAALSAIVIQNDQLGTTQALHGEEEANDLFEKITQIDGKSLAYTATHRSIFALQNVENALIATTSAWVDGFAAGVQWGERKTIDNNKGE